MNDRRWVALIGSELQLLSLIEARSEGLIDGHRVDVLVLGRYRPAVDLLSVVARAGLRVRVASRRDLLALTQRPRVAVGDFFGQTTLLRLARGGLSEVVVLEDGLSSLAAIMRPTASDTIVRPRLHRAPLLARTIDSHAARTIRDLVGRGALHWMLSTGAASVLERRHVPVAGMLHTHQFDALRHLDPPKLGIERAITRVVVGSSYATRNLISEAFYVEWLYTALSAEPETTLFVPHRDEAPIARHLAVASGALVSTVPASVERVVLALAQLQRIDCLPSTPALSLATLGHGERLVATGIPDDQWDPTTPMAFRSLAALTSTTRQPQ